MGQSATVIIPARFGSTRFPGKPLAQDTGKPLIQHVYEQAQRATRVERVVVATDDQRILDAVHTFGGDAVMTREDHPNGTARLEEAASILGLQADAVVVNVQGDEPEIDPADIDAAIEALGDAEVATLAAPMDLATDDPHDPNVVKAVVGPSGRALYFSRACIPSLSRADGPVEVLRHVGLYVYRVGFLAQYVALQPTRLEKVEQLEQLRVLEHGYEIAVAIVSNAQPGIDTPEQYEAFVARYRGTA